MLCLFASAYRLPVRGMSLSGFYGGEQAEAWSAKRYRYSHGVEVVNWGISLEYSLVFLNTNKGSVPVYYMISYERL